MTDAEICPTCHNPKRTRSPGSLTQWIVSCNCDQIRADEIPEVQDLSIRICAACGKRIGEGRPGSFTQFIFRSDTCQCDRPEPVYAEGARTEVPPESNQIFEEDQEQELELTDDNFPVDRYKPLAELGGGAGGSVYLARDRLLNKKVAIKVRTLEPKMVIAFQDEAKATSKLTHPSIVNVMDFGITPTNASYMVLEYVAGQSLADYERAHGAMHWSLCLKLFSPICSALSYAHEQGVYHRDISPDNIMLIDVESAAPQVRIIDFGLAQFKTDIRDDTDSGPAQVVGTPLYMSPDLGLGRQYDARSEIYSLGCVMFEALTGRPPFEGATALETLSLHATSEPPALGDLSDEEFPDELPGLLSRMLAKHPDERYQSMDEVNADILSTLANNLKDEAPATSGIQEKLALFLPLKLQESMSEKLVLRIAVMLLGAVVVISAAYLIVAVSRSLLSLASYTPPEVNQEIARNNEKFKELIKHEPEKLALDMGMQVIGVPWEITDRRVKIIDASDEDFKKLETELARSKFKSTITSLRISYTSTSTGDGLQYLRGHPFKKITVMTSGFNDVGARYLSTFKTARMVDIFNTAALTDTGIASIAKLPVTYLKLKYIRPLPPSTLKLISKMKTLKYLQLGSSAPIRFEDLHYLKRLPKLQLLDISDSPLDDTMIDDILALRLKELRIINTRVSDSGVMRLAKNKRLKKLYISTTGGITEAGLQGLRIFRPDLKVVNNSNALF